MTYIPSPMLMNDLSQAEIEVLRFVGTYGPQVDFGGRGASRARLNACKLLIHKDLLYSHYRSASLTPVGKAVLSKINEGQGA